MIVRAIDPTQSLEDVSGLAVNWVEGQANAKQAAAVKAFAAPNGFHMILHYSEPLTEADKKSAANIQRKLVGPGSSGAVCPMYFVDGMDVSAGVINTLNTMFPAATTTAPAAGAH